MSANGDFLGWNRRHLALALAIVALGVAEAVSVYAELPDPMASNFGASGEPGGWSSKLGFFSIAAAGLLCTFVPFLGLPILLSRTPTRYLNVPNRDYWLASERRRDTLVSLRDSIGSFLVVSLSLLVFVQHLVYEANLATGRLGAEFLWAFGAYVVYTGWWLARIFRRYRRPKETPPSG